MPYSNGQVTVTTTPTPICSVAERGGIVIQNNGSAAVGGDGDQWNESGDWIPRVQNPLTGLWEDIEPGEILDA
jgi:hypothetical protein